MSLGRSHRRSRGTRRDDAGTRSTAPTPPGRPRFPGQRLPRPHRCRRGTGETRQRPGWDSSLWADARDRSTGNSSPQVASQLQRDTQRSRDPLPSPALGQVTVLRFWPGHTEDSLPPDCSRGDLRPRAKDVLKAAGPHGPQCAGQGPGTGEAGPRDVPEAVGSASGPVSGLCHLSGLAGRAPRAPVVLGRAPRSAEAEACRVRGRVSRWHCHPIRERTEPRHCPFVSSVRRKSCRRQPGPRSPGRPPAVPGLCAPAGRRGATAEWPMGSPAPSPEARMGTGPGAGQEGHAGPAAGRAPRPPALPRALWQLGKPCGPSPQAPWAATALASPAGARASAASPWSSSLTTLGDRDVTETAQQPSLSLHCTDVFSPGQGAGSGPGRPPPPGVGPEARSGLEHVLGHRECHMLLPERKAK